MKRSMLIVLVLAAVSAFVTVPAYAETVQGQVKEVNTQSNYLKLDRTDLKSGKAEEIKVAVDGSTQFNGAVSLSQLRIGEPVIVEADQNVLTRQWKAKMIHAGSALMAGI